MCRFCRRQQLATNLAGPARRTVSARCGCGRGFLRSSPTAPRRRGGRCGGSGWFSRLGALLFGSVAADFEKRQVALKAASRALPVAALRPRPKYVLFDRYAGAHSCLAASEHRCGTEPRRFALRGTLVCLGTLGLLVSRHTRFASVSRHARPCHSLLAARAAAMATAEQWRSLCRQAMPVGEACAQCVCPSWRWRCTMQRFRLSVETPSAAQSFFCASHVRFPGVGDVSKTRSEAWEQSGAAWYGTAPGGPLRPRRSKTK